MHLKWEVGDEHAFGGGKNGRIYVAFSVNVVQHLMGGDVIDNKNSIGIVEGIWEINISLRWATKSFKSASLLL